MTFIDYGSHLNGDTLVAKVADGIAVAAFTLDVNYTAFIKFTGKQASLDIIADNDPKKVTKTRVSKTDTLGNILNKGIAQLV